MTFELISRASLILPLSRRHLPHPLSLLGLLLPSPVAPQMWGLWMMKRVCLRNGRGYYLGTGIMILKLQIPETQ
jgi:hypothetical protein